MTRLLITRPLPEATLAAARALADDVVVRPVTDGMTEPEMIAALQDFDVILLTLGDFFSAAVFAQVPGPRCRLLANFGVGFNHIDVDAARAAGIAVTNTPGAVTDATADIAMMLILMSCRRAGQGERMVRANRWTGWHPTQLLGQHVTGKTVGIVGMGRIGQAVARRCHFGFGMRVVFFNRSSLADSGVPATQLDSLQAVAGAADVLVIALPGGANTRHMIGADVLAAMAPHAHLVNIARGEIVDEAALIEALQAGRIAGAGLDVFEHEPHVPSALIEMENVTLLPHTGTSVLEVRLAMGQVALDNIAAFLRGAPLPNAV